MRRFSSVFGSNEPIPVPSRSAEKCTTPGNCYYKTRPPTYARVRYYIVPRDWNAVKTTVMVEDP